MKGLLTKDFLMIKKHCILIFLISFVFLAISMYNKSIYLSFYSAAMVSIIPVILIGYDDGYKWNKYEMITPVSRKVTVIEKYLLLLIFIIPIIAAESLILYFRLKLKGFELIGLTFLLLFCSVIVPVIVLPIIYKFGYLKGKMINLIIVGILSCGITLLNIRYSLFNGKFIPHNDIFLFGTISVILFAISIFLSIKFYSKREF